MPLQYHGETVQFPLTIHSFDMVLQNFYELYLVANITSADYTEQEYTLRKAGPRKTGVHLESSFC